MFVRIGVGNKSGSYSGAGGHAAGENHVYQERERVRDRVLVDYGAAAAEPRERVRQEAGRLFLHCQYLPSEMRVEVPQSAHHAHLRVLQALPGTSRAAPQLLETGLCLCAYFFLPNLHVFDCNEWTCGFSSP